MLGDGSRLRGECVYFVSMLLWRCDGVRDRA